MQSHQVSSSSKKLIAKLTSQNFSNRNTSKNMSSGSNLRGKPLSINPLFNELDNYSYN